MTLSLKNTIATLALLVAIFMMSGCGALNSLADDAKDALDDLDLSNIDGFSDLSEDDPCLKGNALFTSESCNGDENRRVYNNLREASCIQDNNSFFCANTTTRICVTEERLNNVLCIGALYDLLRTQRDERLEAERLSVVIADWTDGTNEDGLVDRLNVEPNSAHTGNQFLSGLHGLGALPTSDQVQGSDALTSDQKAGVFAVSDRSDRGTLTLAYTHPVFDGFRGIDEDGNATDTGDVLDGVVFVSGLYTQQTGCTGSLCSINRHYAGLLPTTDLGAPLTETLAQGTWHGWIQTRGDVSYNQRFDLTITFDESTNGGTIVAYVADAITALKIDGVFNNHGFVTGDILHGDIAPDNQIGDNKSPGQLRGLIGDEGAVVAFISDATGPRDDTTDTPAQYSGGFVAYVPNSGSTATPTGIPNSADSCVKDYTCVDYAHWAASTTASPTDTPRPSRFLKGTVAGLAGIDQGDVAGSSSLANLNPQTGDAKDGYAFYLPDATGSVHNVGIYSTTRLGAPLGEDIAKAQWPGLLYHRAGTDAITTSPITLNVGFSTGANTGTIDGKNGVNREGLYEIIASYNDRGVIHGTIVRTAKSGDAITGANTGQITGLIGTEGAVGVFLNHASSSVSFVGGFLALPPVVVDYADWVAVASPTDTPTEDQFLKVMPSDLQGNSRLNFGGITNTAANVLNHASTHILNAGDAGDGFAVYRVVDGAAHNAGILSTTDLGAPLTGTITNAQWPGSLLTRVGTGLTIPSLITLNVNFDGTDGTIAGSNSLSDFAINARFNNAGVISGDVTHTQRLPNNVITGGSGPVTGLIGVDGAVAVFRNSPNSGTNYVGGFVAQPSQGRAPDPCIKAKTCVDYAHWAATNAANPTDTPMPNQFLKGTPNGLAGVASDLDIAHLDTAYNTNFYSLSGGDTKDGFGIYRPINRHSSGSFHNVGIYSTTNLGAPLRGTFTNALWAGTLQDRVGTTGGLINAVGITLTVGFNAGTSAGTITYGNVGTTHQIDATFNDIGVIRGDITRRAGGDTSTGVISGLIGAEGAVGVFRNNVGTTTSYVGGFVASPPPPNG